MKRVFAEQFEREPEIWMAIAETEPVLIIRNGEDDVVIMAYAEYARLRRRDDVEAETPHEAPNSD